MRTPDTNYRDRPPRSNAFAGICRCGTNVEPRAGWIWKGGVYCRYPSIPGQCPKATPHD